jgi:dTDP-4-dehydrorhamnose reductase
MKYLVTGQYLETGAAGQLAAAFARRFEQSGADFSYPRLDITDFDAVMEAVSAYRPDVILNCAAYNLVDKAETDHVQAFKINAFGPALLSHAAKKYNSTLVHYGSDYIFDGLKKSPYVESDPANPLSQYGKSKLAGEQLAAEGGARTLILRLSWVFGPGQQNFIHKLKEWARDGRVLKMADDDISVPTYTEDAVDVTLKAVESGLSGVYHLTSSGVASRYEWAEFVLKELGLKNKLERARRDDFNLPAKRPGFSAMSNRKIAAELNLNIPEWRDAVRSFLKKEVSA